MPISPVANTINMVSDGDQAGKTIIVTRSDVGVGFETALAFYEKGQRTGGQKTFEVFFLLKGA